MAKKKEIVVIDTQKDGEIVIETVVEKTFVPVLDVNGMITHWTEE